MIANLCTYHLSLNVNVNGFGNFMPVGARFLYPPDTTRSLCNGQELKAILEKHDLLQLSVCLEVARKKSSSPSRVDVGAMTCCSIGKEMEETRSTGDDPRANRESHSDSLLSLTALMLISGRRSITAKK
jgi:hypothetical protein